MAAICHLLSAIAVHASSPQSSESFLRIDGAARPAALGSAYTAAAGDVDSLAYNPGGLASVYRPEVNLTYAEWYLNTNYSAASFAQPIGPGTLAVGAALLDLGQQQGRDALGHVTGDFSAQDAVYSLAYAQRLGSMAGLGATFKYIHSYIASDNASTYAFDVGGVGQLASNVWIGASVLNIGPSLKYLDQADPLPLTFAVGAAYRPFDKWKFLLDIHHESHDVLTDLALGGEYMPFSFIALRAGYVAPLNSVANQSFTTLEDLRGGVGLLYKKYRADYAITSSSDLGLTQHFTLSATF